MTVLATEYIDFPKKSTIAELYDGDELLFTVTVKFGDLLSKEERDSVRHDLSHVLADGIKYLLNPEAALRDIVDSLLNGVSE